METAIKYEPTPELKLLISTEQAENDYSTTFSVYREFKEVANNCKYGMESIFNGIQYYKVLDSANKQALSNEIEKCLANTKLLKQNLDTYIEILEQLRRRYV